MPDNTFGHDASGRLTYEMFRMPAGDYPAVCAAVVAEFALAADSTLLMGPDQMFLDFRRGEQIVELAWDNWSGFFVTAKNPEAALLVLEIGAFLGASSWAGIGQQKSST